MRKVEIEKLEYILFIRIENFLYDSNNYVV